MYKKTFHEKNSFHTHIFEHEAKNLKKTTSSSQQKCLKFFTVKLGVTSALRELQTLLADEGLDERPAVGIGITLRDEAGEDGRAGDEGRSVSGKNRVVGRPSFYFFASAWRR